MYPNMPQMVPGQPMPMYSGGQNMQMVPGQLMTMQMPMPVYPNMQPQMVPEQPMQMYPPGTQPGQMVVNTPAGPPPPKPTNQQPSSSPTVVIPPNAGTRPGNSGFLQPPPELVAAVNRMREKLKAQRVAMTGEPAPTGPKKSAPRPPPPPPPAAK